MPIRFMPPAGPQDALIGYQAQDALRRHYTDQPGQQPLAGPPAQAPAVPDGEVERAMTSRGGPALPGVTVFPGTRTQVAQEPAQLMGRLEHMSSNRQGEQLQVTADGAQKLAATIGASQVAQKVGDAQRRQLAEVFAAEYRAPLQSPEGQAAINNMVAVLGQRPPSMRGVA